MEPPVQLSFFKKLELFQELKAQNKRARDFRDFQPVWDLEKRILIWAYKNHHNPSAAITPDKIRTEIFKGEDNDENITQAISNLLSREYLVKKYPGQHPHLLFTKEGLLMGEVIYATWSDFGFYYDFLYILIWAAFLTGAITIIINFFVLIYPWLLMISMK